jgi:hypothetical protein
MARSALSALVALASLTLVAGQSTAAPTQTAANGVPSLPATPLVSEIFPYTALPQQVYPNPIVRGTQSGYNRCNSTTQNQNSLCQTILVNNISDFCIWAPAQPNSTIADTEGEEVGWCTKNGYGTRGIVPGTFTGLQVLRTSQYLQIIGFINQPSVNMQASDFGGELDSGGQDEAGNPMGGLVYTTFFSTDGSIAQTQYWTEFIGGGIVGMKICDPKGTNPQGYCQHTLDRIGLPYNMPNAAQNGTFEVCDSDLMDIPGVYTSGGQTLSYSQPAESLGAITSIPYQPRTPSSSNCQTYKSSQVFTDFASLAASTTGASSAPTGSGASRSGSGSAANPTSGSKSNRAESVTISLFTSILGVAVSVAFLA